MYASNKLPTAVPAIVPDPKHCAGLPGTPTHSPALSTRHHTISPGLRLPPDARPHYYPWHPSSTSFLAPRLHLPSDYVGSGPLSPLAPGTCWRINAPDIRAPPPACLLAPEPIIALDSRPMIHKYSHLLELGFHSHMHMWHEHCSHKAHSCLTCVQPRDEHMRTSAIHD
ncbi:unnamed protein product [Linum trigynum]|uniref:Uncharacterized protein n=1 Tax=Linum trigynum TaxID=586398 RepID=A0AAV2GNJ0_9ROSI